MIAQLINIEERNYDFTNDNGQRNTGSNYYLTYSRKDDKRIITVKTSKACYQHWLQGMNETDAKKIWWNVEYVIAVNQNNVRTATLTLMTKA